MTPDQYWNGDTWLVRDYLKAEEFRREKENYNAWLNGVYVAKAISATICNAFIDKNASADTYPERPYPLNGESEEEKEAREEREADAAEVYMKMFVEFGKNWGKPK